MQPRWSSQLAVAMAVMSCVSGVVLSQSVESVSTYVPSDVGGSQGLYCEVILPSAPRYAEGAPVVVHVPGGWGSKGTSSPERQLTSAGFIQIVFNFPGGGVADKKSGGDYDERGENCIRALRDIVLFAMGRKADKNGKCLEDLTGEITPIYGNVGLCGWSNGGNATITVAGAFAHDLAGLAWIVNWESPVGDGMPNVEAGRQEQVNPAYDPDTGTWDFTHLAFSDTLTVSTEPPVVRGGLYFDFNANGIFDGDDFKPWPHIWPLIAGKAYYSVRLRSEAESRGIVPSPAPSTLATVEETQAFWHYRNGEYWIEEAVSGNPGLMFMVIASQDDHVQGAPDYPHVLTQYEGFRNAGARLVRLNPDRAYVEAISGSACPEAVDNAAFVAYDHLSVRSAVEPESLPYEATVNAGVLELADRTQTDELSPQLDSVLVEQTGTIDWKPFFTLAPEEGTEFVVDTVVVVEGGGVPVLNLTKSNTILLTSATGSGLLMFEVKDNGRTYDSLAAPARGMDGGFVYLPDGRIRFLSEEPSPTSTPHRHKSRIVSWISADGITWSKEPGIRYQPGAEDDSIASVPAVIQVQDSVWRMYYVGDWYRTNGTRTAISTDWGWTWRAESRGNILRLGDVDPHPVYLTNGKIRLYGRSGMGAASPAQAGISYCDSDDGLHFDTLQVKILIKDSDIPASFKLDPAVIRFPNGDVACYLGTMPLMGQPGRPRLLVAWAKKATGAKPARLPLVPENIRLYQNYPNPFNPVTTIRFSLLQPAHVTLKLFDMLGREVSTLVDGHLAQGEHTVHYEAGDLPSGMYIYRLQTDQQKLERTMELVR